MKKRFILLLLSLFLFSCGEQDNINVSNPIGSILEISKQETISVENDRNIENRIITQPELYTKTTQVTFHDEKDIQSFNEQ